MQDVACSNCRSRKIRCGKERPSCRSCSRDRVECIYTSPTRRVNHVKALCEGFDDLQSRLILVQEELSSLTALFRTFKALDALPAQPLAEKFPYYAVSELEHDVVPHADGLLTRGNSSSVEKYYGPWTLLALCRDFGLQLSTRFGHNSPASSLANQMWLDAEDDIQRGFVRCCEVKGQPIPLPSRQLLNFVLDSFFSRDEYATDIFVRPLFEKAVERVYNDPSDPSSEAWAACFTVIILLVVGEEHGFNNQDTFTRPLLHATSVAAYQSTIFMSLRVVNVQSLALLSLLAQQTHNQTLGDALFAQACMLAKAMGFYQTGQRSSLSALSLEEARERQKIFRSLYIRDRCSAILRGSPTWISTPSIGLNSAQEPRSEAVPCVSPLESSSSAYERNKMAWCELATLQGELHRLIFAPQSLLTSVSESRTLLARIAQRLELWSRKHGVPSKPVRLTVDEVSLNLAFLGTRIRVIEAQKAGDMSGAVDTQELHDARLSSLLLLISCGALPNDGLADRIRTLLSLAGGNRPDLVAEPTSSAPPSPTTKVSFTERQPPHTPPRPVCTLGSQDPRPHPSIGIHRLAIAYPTIAPFILARNILGMSTAGRSTPSPQGVGSGQRESRDEGDEDRELLQALAACFRDAPALQNSCPDNHAAQVGGVIERLVDIVSLDGKHAGREDTLLANPADVLPSAGFPLWSGSNGTPPCPLVPNMAFGPWVDVSSGTSDTRESTLGEQWADSGSSTYPGQPFNRGNRSPVSLPDMVPRVPAFGSPPMEQLGTYPVDTIWGQHGQQLAVPVQQQPGVAVGTCGDRRVKRPRKEFGPDA
ncbi:Thiamine repressible genes regulatory protein thi1 [Madurella fahalii]|uniref:Thiamine repressible genes regulatory protein thi1 n=1 Tax=Madurella fahalii TaxID=1157608 RepID=A0ABQ0GQQ4_9PEZI